MYMDFCRERGIFMKMKPVLSDSFRLYKKNFGPLCLTLLVQLVLRAMALSPVLFLANKALAPLAYLAIPLYILIVLPARQNYAIALQNMLDGGNVFTTQLISGRDYGKKLLRGVKGMLCILLWSALTITGVSLLYAAVMGLVDFITLMRIFSAIGGNVMDGVMIVAGAVAASCLLIVLGCAVHSGSRHAIALGNKRLMKGNRLRLTALWFLGCALVLPFAAVLVYTLGDYALSLVRELKNLKIPAFTLNAKQTVLLVGGALVLLFPAMPLKNLLPAVYLRRIKEARDAQA